jgi:hypothetical protein
MWRWRPLVGPRVVRPLRSAGHNPYAVPDLYQYNDLPVRWDGNVNVGETPHTLPSFAGGNAPTLATAEIDERVAFLCTLTEGFDPNNPTAYNVPAQCAPGAK